MQKSPALPGFGYAGGRWAAGAGLGSVAHHDFAAQREGAGLGDLHIDHLADQAFVAREIDHAVALGAAHEFAAIALGQADRKSTRLNSSHLVISYAVFCLKKKNKYQPTLSHD